MTDAAVNDRNPIRRAPVRLANRVELHQWQRDAVDAWLAGDSRGPYRGTMEIFTGGGKSLIAVHAFVAVSEADPDVRLAIVVPSEALARQWVQILLRETTLEQGDVGMMGAGSKDSFTGKRVLVCVLNSAAKKLPSIAQDAQPLMLILDECHRAGAATYSKVLATTAAYRLGLSATPSRDETDEAGLPLSFDRQIVGQKMGSVVFSFGLRQAREIGWLPEYMVHHHGLCLVESEAAEYEKVSSRVSDAADRIEAAGYQPARAWSLAMRGGDAGQLAKAYISAVSQRKDFLYRVSERGRVAARLVEDLLQRTPTPRILLFHERVAEVEVLFKKIGARVPDARIGIEHSELPTAKRQSAVADFRAGRIDVLVSVKSLVEGIDVPDADVGISVASSSSVRQRVQTLGRVLRRRFDGGIKRAEMHVMYVRDTVDESIYGKEDWSDLTGPDSNRFWHWPLDPLLEPTEVAEPPQKPKPTEEAEWLRFGETVPATPQLWLGELPEYEFSVDTRGNVTTTEGGWIANPQGVAELVAAVRKRPGGRFRVTPKYNLVIVFGEADGRMSPYLAGRLDTAFTLTSEADVGGDEPDMSIVMVGSPYPGPVDRTHGTFSLRHKKGGVIERKVGQIVQFAITEPPNDALAENATHCIAAWKQLVSSGFTFHVNQFDHAWYRQDGEARFLAAVPQGFRWPDVPATSIEPDTTSHNSETEKESFSHG